MKGLLLVLCLVSAQAFSYEYTKQYSGQTFKLEEQQKCEAEYDKITDALSTLPGFIVFDGYCKPIGQNHLQIVFNYESPITETIDKYEYQFATQVSCENQAMLGAQVMNSEKDVVVAAYCSGSRYNLHYVDYSHFMIRELRLGAEFKSLSSCETQMNEIGKMVSKQGMSALLKECREFKSLKGDKGYKASFFYRGIFSKSLEVINTRIVKNDCLEQEINIERGFSDANIDLTYKFCDDEVGYSQANEILIYLDPTGGSFSGLVKNYQGVMYTNLQVCLDKKDEVIAKFAKINRLAVYSYCNEVRKGSFVPSIYYVNKK